MRKGCLVGLVGAFAVLSDVRPAEACGGCFHEAPTPQKPVVESSIVSDHRMVFSITTTQTVLWDQIRYNGNPKDFVWVLPVKQGARIELSRDEWIAALDARTQPQVTAPRQQPTSFGGGDGYYGGDYSGANGGCGCGAMSDTTSAYSAEGAGYADGGSAAPPPPPPVQVVSQEVVGPYATVIVRSDQPKALEQWLRDHGYAIPDSVLPIIEAYTTEKFDFVALRLAPGANVRAMQPVRVVSPGADPTLPLRMVAAGVGANVGLTLYVLSEGRYRPRNFPEGQIDDTKLFWDFTTNRSNYQELSTAIMAGGQNRTWLTEFAGQELAIGGIPTTGSTASLYDAYYSQCYNRIAPPEDAPYVPPTNDAGSDGGADDGGADGGADGGSTSGNDGGTSTSPVSGLCTFRDDLCCTFDDLALATEGVHGSSVWVTRLRADLPVAALAQDLALEAHPSQALVSNAHQAQAKPTNGTTASVAPKKRTPFAFAVTLLGAGFFVARVLRRRVSRR